MTQTVGRYGILQGAGHMFLTDNLVKAGWSPFTVEGLRHIG
jgi:hypothetical protein